LDIHRLVEESDDNRFGVAKVREWVQKIERRGKIFMVPAAPLRLGFCCVAIRSSSGPWLSNLKL